MYRKELGRFIKMSLHFSVNFPILSETVKKALTFPPGNNIVYVANALSAK